MAVFRCKMCDGDLDYKENATVMQCTCCRTWQTVPKVDEEEIQNLFNRANLLLRKCDFDKAEQVYERILEKTDNEPEAHWGMILCKYGIEYVKDPASGEHKPTCHRTSYDSIVADEDYKLALQYADFASREIYEKDAREIDAIQKQILSLAEKEERYDVFICYKETDERGNRTKDSVIANDIYHQLTQEGLKVFYAAITLEDKLGKDYEPIIFAALNSAKVMLAIGTRPEYYNAVWVKNEWSRFLKIIKKDRTKLLIPCYRDMDAYDLPEEFGHLQAQDMSKVGFITDLIRGIRKVMDASKPKEAAPVKETVVVNQTAAPASVDIAPLLKRVFMFLEDKKWAEADEYCEKVLDINPECAEAYLGKLLAELKVVNKDLLVGQNEPFDRSEQYSKIIRFGDAELKNELEEYNREIRERNEHQRKESIYQKGDKLSKSINPDKQLAAAEEFEKILGYRDADQRAKDCRQQGLKLKYNAAINMLEKAETSKDYAAAGGMFHEIAHYSDAKSKEDECIAKAEELAEMERKDEVYTSATSLMMDGKKLGDIDKLQQAISRFKSVEDWKDSKEKIEQCRMLIKQIEGEKAKKKKIGIIVGICAVVVIALVAIFYPIVHKSMCYKNGDYKTLVNDYGMTDFVIPDGVTEIKDDAFSGCNTLKSVTIPSSVTSIGGGAFSDCDSLANITIPDGVTSIGEWAFFDCDFLTSITIPNSVTSIGDRAFYDCTSLTSITIPDSVTSISEQAFYNCSSLTSITIPDSVTSIGEYAFYGCSSLTSVTIGNGVTSIGSDAFSCCTALTSVTIGNGVTSIGKYAFSGCSSLTSITIPDSVTSIGDSVFKGCSSLTSITIPDSITSIGEWAFSNCSSLTSITIPKSVKAIGKYAFYDCKNLKNIYYSGSTSEWSLIGTGGYYGGNDQLTKATIHYNWKS